MPPATSRDLIYYRRRYTPEVIELCVRWYLTYRLSYRNLSAMMAEREVAVTHTTIMRWVHRFVPEFERRWSRFSKPSNSSWRVDETNVRVRGRWHYLYRAVDRHGKSVHSLLCPNRNIDSAQAFFRQAVEAVGSGWPQKINLDGNAASHSALRLLAQSDTRWKGVDIRARRYLNNIVEQDHRAIQQRCASMLGLKSFQTAAITLCGIELAHRIRKRQFALPYRQEGRALSLKELWRRAVSPNARVDSTEHTEKSLTHQISIRHSCSEIRKRRSRSDVVRYARRIAFGKGLFFLVMPNARRLWRYRYRFKGIQKMISLGTYPEVSTESAQARHRAAQKLLAFGIDPVCHRLSLRRISDLHYT